MAFRSFFANTSTPFLVNVTLTISLMFIMFFIFLSHFFPFIITQNSLFVNIKKGWSKPSFLLFLTFFSFWCTDTFVQTGFTHFLSHHFGSAFWGITSPTYYHSFCCHNRIPLSFYLMLDPCM